jgi:acyl-CoA thioester hydrolase
VTLSAHVDLGIEFYDCDPLFVVWHGRYFKYLEQARQELLRQVDLDIPQIAALGYRMYVTDARCRYMFPLSYGDQVRITAKISKVSPLILVTYDVFNVTHDRRSARASTALATTDSDGNLLTTTPDAIASRLTD